MNSTKLSFQITQDVLNLGVEVVTAQIQGVQNNKSTPELNQFIEQELNAIKESWSNKNFEDDSSLI